MRTFDLLKLSTRMFRTRTMRTSLTILGVSVGIGTIVFLVSLGYGLQTILLEKITTSESLLSLDVFPPDAELLRIDAKTLEEFKNLPAVVDVVPLAIYPIQVSVGNTITDATGNVTDVGYFRLSGLTPEAGKLYASGGSSKGIIISTTLAELFEWSPDRAIGHEASITLFYQALQENGTMKSQKIEIKDTIIGVVAGDTPFAYFPPSILPDLKITEFAQAKVLVERAEVLDGIRNQIVDRGYSVSALSDVVDQANKIFNALQIVLGVFGTAALIVSAIGMFNTMTIAFLERTQEIGIMRALGASRSDMFWLFVVESALMGFLGGFVGIMIGFIGQESVNLGLNVLARSLGGKAVDLFRTPLWFIATIIIFSTSVGLFTGIVPGRRASRLNPLQALMYK